MKLGLDFYTQPDILKICKQLLGTVLMSNIDGKITGGRIVELEAYRGSVDKASHAFPNKITPRTSTMFENGGVAYVYLCYGIHRLFNIVTNSPGEPDVILIRALQPEVGENHMMERRGIEGGQNTAGMTSGPGKLTAALSIGLEHNNIDLIGDTIWVETDGPDVRDTEIKVSERIGVGYAGEDALLPWRFSIKDNTWVSR